MSGIRRGVIGVLWSPDGRSVLMVQRAEKVARGGLWCFPGGHVEAGETPRAALVREFSEELGLQVEPVERLGAVRLPEAGYVLATWRVRATAGEIVPAAAEIADFRWVPASEIERITPGLPSNACVARMLSGRGE